MRTPDTRAADTDHGVAGLPPSIATPGMAARGQELWEAYPRIVKGMVVGIVLLLSMDVVLAAKRVQYSRDFTRMRAAMTETERGRVDALASELQNDVGLAAELARRQGRSEEHTSELQ